ncbi:phosphatase PAP2 family protein [Corynebacterium marinum]|uniref:Phosphatidic acid phosphatase type 2/haloperoxidase domain-containing protein n=1 Tax=Corynebacterium marinum DSM 44953 TaxID=1224162 RepID=A0A0B6TIY9_9CORY|nr:phosphatase PAP2 family protein [Corynebacterium marinum]AJK69907.1 hypothetical protein B840_11680 [Corynebacterium marinum DSM 44953]GGO19359.1 phosphatase PAP2 family protein [Corynebacterium marinum]
MSREVDLLVRLQDELFERPGVVRTATALSHFGEHSLGWFALSGTGAAVDGRRRRQWLALGASAFTSHAASVVIKRIVRRTRPHDPRIRVGVGTPSRMSFPSSHATSTAAALTSLADLTGSRLPLLGIPVMMVSRMVLGVHYPTDTLAGAVLGAATARVVSTIERKTA